MIAILLLALSFPQNPQYGDMWQAPNHREYIWLDHWALVEKCCEVKVCGPGTHLHPSHELPPKPGFAGWSMREPDVKGGPLPKADGKCHADNVSDRRVQ